MDDYKKYLAQQLLTEDKLVTYRLLSRALKVHVNTAKEMLYEFHKWQNDKKPGSLHATYLVYGTMKKGDQQQDGDVEMSGTQTSEDDHAPFSDEVDTQTLSLVKEEQLQEVLGQYDEVTSIHVYSLAPHPLKDLQLLADTARQVLEVSSPDDAKTSAKVYGSISNPNVRKRERRGPGPRAVPSAPVSASAPKIEAKPHVKQEPKPASSTSTSAKEEAKTTQPTKQKPLVVPTAAKKSSAGPSLKRQGSSGIGQMFAKAASKPKKPAATASATASKASSAAASPAEEEPSMAMSDDGEDDAEPEDVKQEDNITRQTRKDRQADLRRMMEESDEEEAESKAATPAEEPMEEDEPPAPESEPEPKAEEPTEMVSSIGDGRRRGRRRVTRKKQIMDDEGYLVTVQEAGWESFSEDEAPPPQPKAAKPAAKPAATAQPAAKAKKPAGKGAQGNIMSFFGKK